eukprot:TRINITY_DN549_c0_g1_i1.p1 TRINITY_DN549_c0_g1~~TRINITY_DN549_c0_g1_i1.p1  ORF type:complete len:132 (+),score=27.01 TRINITY_DN549_c0_g1_i1:27-422(+)
MKEQRQLERSLSSNLGATEKGQIQRQQLENQTPLQKENLQITGKPSETFAISLSVHNTAHKNFNGSEVGIRGRGGSLSGGVYETQSCPELFFRDCFWDVNFISQNQKGDFSKSVVGEESLNNSQKKDFGKK